MNSSCLILAIRCAVLAVALWLGAEGVWFVPLALIMPVFAPTSCVTFSDNFTRANSTNIGSDWTEDVGDWSIASNALTVSSTGAIAKCNTPAPAVNNYEYTVTLDSSNSVYRLFVNYTDSSNWHCAELKLSTSTVKLIECIAGVETVLVSGTMSFGGTIARVCVDSNNFFSVQNLTNFVATTEITPSSAYVALGTGATISGSPTFDGFSLGTPDGFTCLACEVCAGCPASTLRQEITVVVSGYDLVGTCVLCSLANGTYVVELHGSAKPSYAFNPPAGPFCGWYYDTGAVCDPSYTNGIAVLTNNGRWDVYVVGCRLNAVGYTCTNLQNPDGIVFTNLGGVAGCGCTGSTTPTATLYT